MVCQCSMICRRVNASAIIPIMISISLTLGLRFRENNWIKNHGTQIPQFYSHWSLFWRSDFSSVLVFCSCLATCCLMSTLPKFKDEKVCQLWDFKRTPLMVNWIKRVSRKIKCLNVGSTDHFDCRWPFAVTELTWWSYTGWGVFAYTEGSIVIYQREISLMPPQHPVIDQKSNRSRHVVSMLTDRVPRCTLLPGAVNGWKMSSSGHSMTYENSNQRIVWGRSS